MPANPNLKVTIKTDATPFAVLAGKMLTLNAKGESLAIITGDDFVAFQYILVGSPGTKATINLEATAEGKKVEVKQKKVKLPAETAIGENVHIRKSSFDVRIVDEKEI